MIVIYPGEWIDEPRHRKKLVDLILFNRLFDFYKLVV